MYCYFHYVYLFLGNLKTVQSFHIVFSRMFLVLLGQSLIQKKLKVCKDVFLYYFNAYCTYKFSQQVHLSWRSFLGISLSVLWNFSLSLENRLVPYEILHIYF